MANIGIFDVLGPIMIGPSSSHTAGAARLGKIAGTIVNKPIKEVSFLLHGSFRETYKGHGTDRALVAGILGFLPDDPNLKDSISIANEKGIIIRFLPADLGQVHPNTVKFIIEDIDGVFHEIVGSSIGGGSIKITEVNGSVVEFTGEYPTLIISHKDVPGAVSKVTAIVYEHNINIAFMKVFRTERGKAARMVFEMDSPITKDIIDEIKKVEAVEKLVVINPVKEDI